MLQTPSKSFRHCSLPRVMWGLFWKWKAWDELLCLHIEDNFFFICMCQLEWFKSKQIWLDEDVFIYSQELNRAVNSDRDLATLSWAHLHYNLWEAGRGFLDFLASLAEWCTPATPLRGLLQNLCTLDCSTPFYTQWVRYSPSRRWLSWCQRPLRLGPGPIRRYGHPLLCYHRPNN